MNQPGTLLDTGPLVALLDKSDRYHERAKELMRQVAGPLRTCEPVIGEVCHLLRKVHPDAPKEALRQGQRGLYHVVFRLEEHLPSLVSILEKYHDRPVSLSDACLIRMAEIYKEPRILTFDSDFSIYRWGKNRMFAVF